MNQNDKQANDSPATLVAIIVAARRAGDRELERESRRRLRQRFGVNLIFVGTDEDYEENCHASK